MVIVEVETNRVDKREEEINFAMLPVRRINFEYKEEEIDLPLFFCYVVRHHPP